MTSREPFSVDNNYVFREIHPFANQFGFCERLTWNPAESPVCDVFRQLNVQHQAASCSSCYDIRDIAIHRCSWLEREFTDRKVRGSDPTSTSRIPLSRLEQPGSIPDRVLPSGSMAARHRKGVTAERFFYHSTSYDQTIKNDLIGPAVAPFRCLTAIPPEGNTRTWILSGCPSLDRGIREAEVESEPRTFGPLNPCSNH
ncbi:hypothetical protein CSKR_107656 [Clonorchis sinensis]|uniref:Uncharacterized protein n=1 Tax=Clonorchis sinensis TaxID=79923 RepID=A0A3R7C8Q8_CLOSI|nr:hypothetical protein CSKR_107656 [Clonorchis sinensis]